MNDELGNSYTVYFVLTCFEIIKSQFKRRIMEQFTEQEQGRPTMQVQKWRHRNWIR